MKLFIHFVVLLLLTSSCGYRTLEGRVKAVYFSTDSVVFTDTLARVQAVTYQNLMRLSTPCLELVDLQQGKTATAFIAGPTIFQKDGWEFLVYPGEHIFISANDSNSYIPTFSTGSKNKIRNSELLVLKTFQELEKRPELPYRLDYTLLLDYTFQTILDLEKVLKGQIASAEKASQHLFDSLCSVYSVSEKFKELTKDYVHNKYDAIVLSLYENYRDTLLAHHVYESKVKALLPEVNGLARSGQFSLNLERNTNHLYACLYPDRGIRNMVIEDGGVEACFDSVVANFTGPARDYLLSRIMYRAYTQGIGVPSSYRKTYRHYSMNKGYRKIIAGTARHTRNLQNNTSVGPNELLMADGKTKVSLENVLAKYRGRYVLVDLWASWCMPCLEEMPALQALRKKYPADKIAFLKVSVDRSIPIWHTRLEQFHSDSLTNYLLLNKDDAVLVKKIGLTTIPRYLLYDREGKIISTDAPPPSDPELCDILDKLLLK